MNIIKLIKQELVNASDEHTKQSTSRFFKEPVKVYGVKSAKVSAITKKYLTEIKTYPKQAVFNLAEELFKSGYCEESWIAASFINSIADKFKASDFKIFKEWIEKYVTNWATCDTFCNHAVGSYIEMYPQYIEELKKMTNSNNRWVKRASAVSLILPARNGKYLQDIFSISDSLLLDRDDMVQKGYGWLLKEASKVHQKEVFDYVMLHKNNMPRTALRYAIEKMPQELRKKAMEK